MYTLPIHYINIYTLPGCIKLFKFLPQGAVQTESKADNSLRCYLNDKGAVQTENKADKSLRCYLNDKSAVQAERKADDGAE